MFLKGRRIAPGEGVTGWVLANGHRSYFSNTGSIREPLYKTVFQIQLQGLFSV